MYNIINMKDKKMENQKRSWLYKKLQSICKKFEKNILSNKTLKCKVVFGPVRSRRLGLVLGINNMPKKVCPYDCVYCPNGKKSCCSICTANCLSPYELFFSVKNKIDEIKKAGKDIDYILFAGSGDPLLDNNLPEQISILRQFGYDIAVFTSSALLWNERLQENLMYADYVSLKVDTVNEDTWIKINRPHQRLKYDLILKGIEEFSQKYRGQLVTDTTLIKNINDNPQEIGQLGNFLNSLKRKTSFFMTPIYPTAEKYALSSDAETLKNLFVIINEKVSNSVMLCCPETDEFFATDDFENELLGLLEIHPVNETAVKTFALANSKLEKLTELIENKIIKHLDHNGKTFYAIGESLKTENIK